MYGYLDRFVADWKEDELIGVLSKLPYADLAISDWTTLIASIGVPNFIHLTVYMPGKEIKIPSLFEVLAIIAAQGILEKAKEMPLEKAKKHVLGELEIEEIDILVARLQDAERASDSVDEAQT